VSTIDFKICTDHRSHKNTNKDGNDDHGHHCSQNCDPIHPTEEPEGSLSTMTTTTEITLDSFSELNEKLTKNLESLIPLFLQLKQMSPEGIWHIYLHNYIEEVALWAVGVENYAHFIAYCLAK
jgi:hypothetical protein